MSVRRVLVTCPPMVGLIEEFRPEMAARGMTCEVPAFTQTVPEARLLELVPDHDGWIIGDDPATRAVLAAGRAGRLRAAVKWGIGIDNVDVAAARELGLGFTNTPHMFGDEVADYAMAYVTALARALFEVDRAIRAGQWPKPAGISLAGRVAGLVGLGNIGRATAARLHAAGLEVVAWDPGLDAPPADTPVMLERWPAGLERCDFLVFTCALTATNRHMLDAAALARVKPGVRIVNVARGPLIDTAALVAALADGRVRAAALDVFETEPLAADAALRGFDNVVFGSHNASNTVEAVRRTSLRAIESLAALLDQADG
ncbi:MAG: phosphoglycerate dehydrogenase [Gammaproteobacteria bacterium]